MRKGLLDVDLTDKQFRFRVSKTVHVIENNSVLNRTGKEPYYLINHKVFGMINEMNKQQIGTNRSLSLEMLNDENFKKEIYEATINDLLNNYVKGFPEVDLEKCSFEIDFDYRSYVYWDISYKLTSIQFACVHVDEKGSSTMRLSFINEKDEERKMMNKSFAVSSIRDVEIIGKA